MSSMEVAAMQPLQAEGSFGPSWLIPTGVEALDVTRPSVMVPQFHVIATMLLWMLATCARVILALLPPLVPLPVLTTFLKRISATWDEYNSVSRIMRKRTTGARSLHSPGAVSQSTIERALTQVLALLNDVPASSNKYAFLQDLADTLIEENRVEGGLYNTINRASLRRGFSRTIYLLGQSLESRGQNLSFLGRLVSHLPSGCDIFQSLTISGPFGKFWSLVGSILSPLGVWSLSGRPSHDEVAHLANLADSDMAEKFAKELLWITEKLLVCGGMDEAVQQWSFASPLPELSLSASPKVQKSLVRLTALLCKALVEFTGTPHEVSLNLILAWLPLLCLATHGGDGPIFNSLEKGDAERQLERLFASLPETDQEQVLSTWLQHYAMSQSDWPNLQNCYNAWCYTTRKLELDMSKVMKLEY